MVKPSISTLVAGLSLIANAVPAVAGDAKQKGAFFLLDLPPGMTVESASGHCYASNPAQCVNTGHPNPNLMEDSKAAKARTDAQIAKVRREFQLQNMRYRQAQVEEAEAAEAKYLQAQAEIARSAAPPGQQ
jgi:hypothetical protein